MSTLLEKGISLAAGVGASPLWVISSYHDTPVAVPDSGLGLYVWEALLLYCLITTASGQTSGNEKQFTKRTKLAEQAKRKELFKQQGFLALNQQEKKAKPTVWQKHIETLRSFISFNMAFAKGTQAGLHIWRLMCLSPYFQDSFVNSSVFFLIPVAFTLGIAQMIGQYGSQRVEAGSEKERSWLLWFARSRVIGTCIVSGNAVGAWLYNLSFFHACQILFGGPFNWDVWGGYEGEASDLSFALRSPFYWSFALSFGVGVWTVVCQSWGENWLHLLSTKAYDYVENTSLEEVPPLYMPFHFLFKRVAYIPGEFVTDPETGKPKPVKRAWVRNVVSHWKSTDAALSAVATVLLMIKKAGEHENVDPIAMYTLLLGLGIFIKDVTAVKENLINSTKGSLQYVSKGLVYDLPMWAVKKCCCPDESANQPAAIEMEGGQKSLLTHDQLALRMSSRYSII